MTTITAAEFDRLTALWLSPQAAITTDRWAAAQIAANQAVTAAAAAAEAVTAAQKRLNRLSKASSITAQNELIAELTAAADEAAEAVWATNKAVWSALNADTATRKAYPGPADKGQALTAQRAAERHQILMTGDNHNVADVIAAHQAAILADYLSPSPEPTPEPAATPSALEALTTEAAQAYLTNQAAAQADYQAAQAEARRVADLKAAAIAQAQAFMTPLSPATREVMIAAQAEALTIADLKVDTAQRAADSVTNHLSPLTTPEAAERILGEAAQALKAANQARQIAAAAYDVFRAAADSLTPSPEPTPEGLTLTTTRWALDQVWLAADEGSALRADLIAPEQSLLAQRKGYSEPGRVTLSPEAAQAVTKAESDYEAYEARRAAQAEADKLAADTQRADRRAAYHHKASALIDFLMTNIGETAHYEADEAYKAQDPAAYVKALTDAAQAAQVMTELITAQSYLTGSDADQSAAEGVIDRIGVAEGMPSGLDPTLTPQDSPYDDGPALSPEPVTISASKHHLYQAGLIAPEYDSDYQAAFDAHPQAGWYQAQALTMSPEAAEIVTTYQAYENNDAAKTEAAERAETHRILMGL